MPLARFEVAAQVVEATLSVSVENQGQGGHGTPDLRVEVGPRTAPVRGVEPVNAVRRESAPASPAKSMPSSSAPSRRWLLDGPGPCGQESRAWRTRPASKMGCSTGTSVGAIWSAVPDRCLMMDRRLMNGPPQLGG